MFKITKTYTDFNGTERTEDFYFHFTTTELQRMENTKTDGFTLSKFVDKLRRANEEEELTNLWQDLVLAAYGEKSGDGRHFYKTDAIREDFKYSQAYDAIYRELSKNTDLAVEFFNNVIPDDLKEQIDVGKAMAEAGLVADSNKTE